MIYVANLRQLTNIEEALPDNFDERDFKRGEIYMIDLEDIGYGSRYVQTKSRPGLIIQNNIGNTHSHTLIVALLTSTDKRDFPFQYKFKLNGRDSIIMFEQIMTIDKFRAKNKMGELTPQQMQDADSRLMYSLGLNKFSLENIIDFNVISENTKRTRKETKVYFEIELYFQNNQTAKYNVSFDELKKFDSTITSNINFDELKKKLDSCRGLNWIANNALEQI